MRGKQQESEDVTKKTEKERKNEAGRQLGRITKGTCQKKPERRNVPARKTERGIVE